MARITSKPPLIPSFVPVSIAAALDLVLAQRQIHRGDRRDLQADRRAEAGCLAAHPVSLCIEIDVFGEQADRDARIDAEIDLAQKIIGALIREVGVVGVAEGDLAVGPGKAGPDGRLPPDSCFKTPEIGFAGCRCPD